MGTDSQSDRIAREEDHEGYRCSDGVCELVKKKRLSDAIIPHILNIYSSKAKPEDFEIYSPDASFEDPIMCARGVSQIKSAFYSIPKVVSTVIFLGSLKNPIRPTQYYSVFRESRIAEYNIQEKLTSPGKGEILIDNKQYYNFFGRDVDLSSLIKLYVDGGKVVRHEDWWDKKPLWNRETVRLPLIGRIAELGRRGSMLATHAMMGFGKDPTV